MILRPCLFAALLCLHCTLSAEEPVQIETTLIAEVRDSVVLPTGRETHRMVPATTLKQGQTIFYTVRMKNPTPVTARDVVVVRRIPENTVYVEGSAVGPAADIDFSVDGGQTFARPAELYVSMPTGERRRALPDDYTHIRWRLKYPLAPGAIALARFQAVFQ
jgi:uncharacterized repeat protein (TIGR01451 family)